MSVIAIKNHIKSHFFFYIITLFLFFLTSASILRFIILQDYIVSYEGECDPETESCFMYCEDENCTDPSYYTIIERHARELRETCGPDVTTCDQAYSCAGDDSCRVIYCNPDNEDEICDNINST